MKTKLLKLLGLFLITAGISYGMDATAKPSPTGERAIRASSGDEADAESEMQKFNDPDIQNIVTNAKQQWTKYKLSTVAAGSQLGQVGSQYGMLRKKLAQLMGLARSADMIGMQGDMGGNSERRNKDNPSGRPAPMGGMQTSKADAMAKLKKANDDFLAALQAAMPKE